MCKFSYNQQSRQEHKQTSTNKMNFGFQVIAREEKGLWGVDYNRGEKTTFATSIQNRDQGRQVMKDGDGDGDGDR